ncbi:MAG: hypothetical protein M9952_12580 [Microthrixaceae bacterium]|nr:hypothetical protein [Microthrixaceae bacterium]MCO5313758.1 hypothetical protein [Microthrixaceae bacterium]
MSGRDHDHSLSENEDCGGRPGGFSLLDHGWWPVVVGLCGALIGTGALSDNSFLTQLATGRLILDGAVPTHDLYTWASEGTPLVVPAWGASGLYALADRVGSGLGVRLIIAACTAALILALWRLSAPAKANVARLGLVSVAALLGVSWWNERPQTFGYLALAAALLVVVERRSAWWLAGIFAVWVPLHGSWAMGVPFVGALIFVRVVESRAFGRREIGEVAAMVAGSCLGALATPYGWSLLTFPLEQLGRESLILIVEWRPLRLDSWMSMVFLAQGIAGSAALLWRRMWVRSAVALGMLALSIDAVRYAPLCAIAMVPLVAPAFAGLGTEEGISSPRRSHVAIVSGALAVAVVALMMWTPSYDLSHYPTSAVDELEARTWVGAERAELPHILTPDWVGNYLEWRYGTEAKPWVDDRAEVHDTVELARLVALLGEDPSRYERVIDAIDDDIVLWQSDTPFVRWLAEHEDYRIVDEVGEWTIACRVASGFCP